MSALTLLVLAELALAWLGGCWLARSAIRKWDR